MYKHYGDCSLRVDGEIMEFDIWADIFGEEVYEYYESLYEMEYGVWVETPEVVPSDTTKVSICAHRQPKTIKKSNKKKGMEQRAKQKKTHHIVPVVLEV